MEPGEKYSNKNETAVIKVLRAGSIGDRHPPKLVLEVVEQISIKCSISAKEARILFDLEGATIAEALIQSLPGGTIDALLVELMRRRASLFAVSFE